MKQLLFLLLVVVAMVSCTSGGSGRRIPVLKKEKSLPDSIVFRAKMIVIEDSTHILREIIDTKIIKVPFGFRTGDTVYIDYFHYRLLDAVAKK